MVKSCFKDFNIYNVVFFKKIRKNTWTFYTCVPKTSMTWFTVPEIWSVADGNWQFWVIFSPFSLIKTKQIRILKSWKKLLEISLYYACVPKITIIWCMVPQIWIETDWFFVILHHFLSPNNSQNQNFKKMKKVPGDIIILHMECGRNFCFVLFFAV